MKPLFVLVTVFLLSASSMAAQGQSQQDTSGQTTPPAVRSAAEEVVLDMVFRDKKGKTIRDIRPEEIHVSEDGFEQKLTSFRVVEGKTAESLSAPKSSSGNGSLSLDPMREVRLVTLVFEGLDQEGKRFFRQALKDILDMTPEQNLYFSILTIDQKLHCIQPFTADHSALLKSVDRSSMWSFIQYFSRGESRVEANPLPGRAAVARSLRKQFDRRPERVPDSELCQFENGENPV
jgi:VWFA-related protein